MVFPAPDGPTIATNSPGRTANDTFLSAAAVPLYAKLTRSNTTSPRRRRGATAPSASCSVGSSRVSCTRLALATAFWMEPVVLAMAVIGP